MGWAHTFLGWLGLGGYEAASPENPLRVSQAYRRSRPLDEDSLTRPARPRLRLEAHDLDRNHGLLFGICNRICDYTVPRLNVTFATEDPEWNAAARKFLLTWYRRADVRGRNSFPRLVWLALRLSLLDGDGAFLLLSDGRVRPIESELIVTPGPPPAGKKIVDGVELGANGEAIAFWICSRNASGWPDPSTARRYAARDVVFFRHAYRFDQVRGTAPVDPILTQLMDERDLHVSYLEKVRNDTRHAAVATMQDGGASLPRNMLGMDASPSEAADGEEDEGPAFFDDHGLKLWTLRPGENVQPITPGTPSANIVSYEEHLVRMMSAALGIPAEFWTLDLRGLSWSTANAVVKIAGDAFRELHDWVAFSIVRPILDWRILLAIRDGELPRPPQTETANGLLRSAFDAYRLQPPEYLWANEQQHLEAARLGQQLGLPVLSRLAAEIGLTFEELLDMRKKELVALYAAAAEVSERTGAQVSISQFTDASQPGASAVPAAADAGGSGQGGTGND